MPNVAEFSDLYKACRNGDINTVKQILTNTNFTGINNFEPNGSTALHAASYFGHTDIVQLLLEQPNIMIQQINQFGLTAYQEAPNDEIRRLFEPTDGKRFWATHEDSL